jgi:alpha-beta hydrolase superfamily lysophospholipase
MMNRTNRRLVTFALLATASLLTFGSDAVAQKATDGESTVVTTTDGWPIHLTYWKSEAGKDASVVVLIHGGGKQNRLVWQACGLVTALVEDGYAVVALDLRKHGESKAPENAPARARSATVSKFDYEAMIPGDLEAIKKFIFEKHQANELNMRKLALVGTEEGSVLAINFTAFDWFDARNKPIEDAPAVQDRTPRGQDVQCLVLISPQESLSGMGTVQPVQALRAAGLSALLIYGSKASSDKSAATKIFTGLGGKQQDPDNQRLFEFPVNIKLSGPLLLQREPRTIAAIKGILKQQLKDKNIPWRDRQSQANVAGY